MSGHGSQFMSTQKLCKRRRKTFVDTVPACITFNSSSPGVSMMTLRQQGSQCLVFGGGSASGAGWLPAWWLMSDSMALCQVRVAMPLSVPARYALAICRLSTGWRSAWFLASMICWASSRVGGLEAGAFAGGLVHAVEHPPRMPR